MAPVLFVVFGGLAYLIFFATFLYLIAFVGDLPGVPRTVDHGPMADRITAFIVDLGLIGLFGLQHTIMARQGFKRGWTAIVPKPVERSVYVLFASIALLILFAFWRPIPQPVWTVEHPLAVSVIWGLFVLGWLIVLSSTFLINHFELFGLKQVYQNLRGAAPSPPRFRQPFFYRLVRHPLYAGFIIAFWATPEMTLGHMLFSVGMTIYILIAIPYEERDLVGALGDDYASYRGRVGMLFPRLRRASPSTPPLEARDS